MEFRAAMAPGRLGSPLAWTVGFGIEIRWLEHAAGRLAIIAMNINLMDNHHLPIIFDSQRSSSSTISPGCRIYGLYAVRAGRIPVRPRQAVAASRAQALIWAARAEGTANRDGRSPNRSRGTRTAVAPGRPYHPPGVAAL